MYSGEEEFNVIIHEGGSREQEHTNEEQRISTTQETSHHIDIIDDIVARVLGWGSRACSFWVHILQVPYLWFLSFFLHYTPVILQDSGEGFEEVAQNAIEDMNVRAVIRESEPLETTTQVRYACSLGHPVDKKKRMM